MRRPAALRALFAAIATLLGVSLLACPRAVRDAKGESSLGSSSSVPTLTVGSVPRVTGLRRIGVDLGTWTTYGAEQFQSNIVMNPGFEPLIDRTMVVVQNHNGDGFSHNSTWPAYVNGFWKNASFEVLSGASAGVTGKIANSSLAGSSGLPGYKTVGTAPTLATGDVIALTQTEANGGLIENWWYPSSSTGLVTINTSDTRPGSPGISSGQMTLQASQPTELDYYWDTLPNTLPGGKFLLVNGAWQLSFWARATAGSPTLTATFQRLSAGSPVWLAQTFTLSTTWQQFTANFTASDTGAPGTVALKLVANGAAGTQVRLDDLQLGRTSDFPNAWRAELVGALKALQPGYLRDWQSQLGDTTANRLASTFGRGPERWLPDPTNTLYQFLYGLPDFLDLCSQVGANPWIVLPPTLGSAEQTALGSYLASAQSTYHFSEMVVEFGDENWNSMFAPAQISNPVTMGQVANRAFAAIKAAAGATPLHLVVNSQFVNPWIGQQAVLNAPLADAADVATYVYSTMNVTDSASTILTDMFTMSDLPPLVSRLRAKIPSTVGIDVYEVNLGTTAGTATKSIRDPYVASQVSGNVLADRLITAMYAGITRQNVWNLAQYNESAGASGEVALFGVVHDLTTAASFRPTGLALEMLNQAVGGDFYPVTAAGPSSVTSGLTAAAFLNHGHWSLAISSANAIPVTLTITLPASGALPTQAFQLAAPALTSTNETATKVRVSRTAIAAPIRVSIPAYGFVVLLPANKAL